MDVLIMRFDAPLMSFGGVRVDQHGPTDRFPGQSQVTGLLANALGYRHGESGRLNDLQRRLSFAARWDVPPVPVRDYQTVDLGQRHLRDAGWTTRGEPEHRQGGPEARFGTHQRFRHYWADGVMTLAAALSGQDEPSTADLATAVRRPSRPLFIGRKSCLPAAVIFEDLVQAEHVLAALKACRRHRDARRAIRDSAMAACWPDGLESIESSTRRAVHDQRDWANQLHVGRHVRLEGMIEEVVE